MKGFSKDANLISIQKTVENHAEIMPYLPAFHILSGCDTVPQIFRIGEKKVLAAGKQIPLEKFMQRDSTEAEYMQKDLWQKDLWPLVMAAREQVHLKTEKSFGKKKL